MGDSYTRDQTIYEEWRPIVDFPNYSISNFGRVANSRGKLLAIQFNEYNGYYQVALWRYNKGHARTIHRLVATAFIDIIPGSNDVNHMDGDKSNNFVGNLEWTTRSENQLHAFRTGLNKTVRVRCVETNEIFNSVTECANRLNIGRTTVSNYIHGHKKSANGYTFELVE
jgi:hypothetical protein